ncbi:hypothetical protein BG011_003777 [Mortierella polycephala]|uniref:Uncharacterized protein n=1 Tax=Mortierella polycephala TaxID=41804 RepID=A0A9P6Q477_9FUNG|nr:hypothetical protein BG011_003777 [Mortierella polycephala]
MRRNGRFILWTKALLLQLAIAIVLGAPSVMNLPPGHISLRPNAYLFEFNSEPGEVGAAQEKQDFKLKIGGMKSVQIRQEFGMLLNGISAQVEDPDELRELMTMSGLRTVTPLTIVSPPNQVQPTLETPVASA